MVRSEKTIRFSRACRKTSRKTGRKTGIQRGIYKERHIKRDRKTSKVQMERRSEKTIHLSRVY